MVHFFSIIVSMFMLAGSVFADPGWQSSPLVGYSFANHLDSSKNRLASGSLLGCELSYNPLVGSIFRLGMRTIQQGFYAENLQSARLSALAFGRVSIAPQWDLDLSVGGFKENVAEVITPRIRAYKYLGKIITIAWHHHYELSSRSAIALGGFFSSFIGETYVDHAPQRNNAEVKNAGQNRGLEIALRITM